MNEIKATCNELLIHINKCIRTMEFIGYTDAGTAGYCIRLPFKISHKQHFDQIPNYVEKLSSYTKENNIDISFIPFEELDNSSVIYNAAQVSALRYPQYKHRLKYLNDLKSKTLQLLHIINT